MRRRKQPPNPSPQDSIARRAALYMRVSTGRQAEHDLSIPDQRRQLESWCRAQGYTVAAEFIESGASAGDDRRPIFQQMIERACDGEQAFDLIAVPRYSRFSREAFEQEFYLRKLAKHGVRVVSITQPVGDESEPAQAMMRKVIALFDEYQSKENAKHVIRSMKENARQGFWNGATAPLGYRLVEAEKRGAKTTARRLPLRPPSLMLLLQSASIPRSSTDSAAACVRSSPPDRCRSERPTCSLSSTSSRWTITASASKDSKDVLERAALAGQAASEPGSQMSTRWRALRDSHPCF